MNLPFPEARERFMNRIKQDNGDIKQQDKEINDLKKMIEQQHRNIKEIDGELTTKPKGAGGEEEGNQNMKYEILYKKEKEINEFMEKYETDRQREEGKLNDLQETIVALLEHMNMNIKRQTNLPS